VELFRPRIFLAAVAVFPWLEIWISTRRKIDPAHFGIHAVEFASRRC